MKSVLYSIGFFILIGLSLSFFFDVAYVHSLIFLLVWASFGHLITLDDDMPGAWGNPEEDLTIWHHSLISLLIKFVLLFIAVWLAWTFPELGKYGSSH